MLIRALYCDTRYIATSPETHSNQYLNLYPNPKQFTKPCPSPNTIAYALIKCCRNIVQSQYSERTLKIIRLLDNLKFYSVNNNPTTFDDARYEI